MEDRNSCQSQRPFAVIQQGKPEVCPRGQKRQKNPEEDSQVLRHSKTRVWGVKKKKGPRWLRTQERDGWKVTSRFCGIYSKNWVLYFLFVQLKLLGDVKKSLKVFMYLMKFYRVNVYHPGRETVCTLLIFTTGDKLLAFNPIIFNLQNGHDIFQVCLKFKFFEQRLWPTLLKGCLKG